MTLMRATAGFASATFALAAALLAVSVGGARATTEPANIHIVTGYVTATRLHLQRTRIASDVPAIVEFRIHNRSNGFRSFEIGFLKVGMKPGKTGYILLHFPVRDSYEYHSSGPKGTKTFRGMFAVI
jgi:hypothetical protein